MTSTRWEIQIGERSFDRWTEAQLDADVLTPADGWAVSLAMGEGRVPSLDGRIAEQLASIRAPERVRVLRDDVLLLSGILDGIGREAGRQRGTSRTLEGRDAAAFLVDSSVPLGLTVERETLFVELVRTVVAPWEIEITTDATEARQLLTGMTRRQNAERLNRERAIDRGIARDAYAAETSRRVAAWQERYPDREVPVDLNEAGIIPWATDEDALGLVNDLANARARRRYAAGLSPRDVEQITVREARPRPGETCWTYLDRHARRLGLLMWMAPDGRLVIATPNYASPVNHYIDVDAGGALSVSSRRDFTGRFSKVLVYGRTGGSDASRSRFKGTAADPDLPWPRLRIVHDAGIRSSDAADRRAKRESRVAAMRAATWVYEVAGHEQGGVLYAPDTMVHVLDADEGLDDALYCYRRTFTASRDNGERTRLYLIPAGALAL